VFGCLKSPNEIYAGYVWREANALFFNRCLVTGEGGANDTNSVSFHVDGFLKRIKIQFGYLIYFSFK
jgi:hypothetical protein